MLLLPLLPAAAAAVCREPQVRLTLAGKLPLDPECLMHPGRKGCKVERLLQQA
jgi:hypothetical protein